MHGFPSVSRLLWKVFFALSSSVLGFALSPACKLLGGPCTGASPPNCEILPENFLFGTAKKVTFSTKNDSYRLGCRSGSSVFVDLESYQAPYQAVFAALRRTFFRAPMTCSIISLSVCSKELMLFMCSEIAGCSFITCMGV